ncbi:MAG: hypothetical protein IPK44_00655 [Candidatus Accumulibacter sp.]|uniref:hypothetical protein n=1 Tax=Accumulibacter sp. TaxID=2053492 RepID=UPI0025868017|nr:hypothetical protein [Accumulibacter sp.]MBK8113112.1 hypothetical protein [Accumulibacter sp.]
MTLAPDALELRFAYGDYGLSARRLWEHTELGQVNVFSKAISSRQEFNDAAEFIDVVCFKGDALSLAGLTLAELKAGRFPLNSLLRGDSVLAGLAQAEDAATFVGLVAKHVDRCSVRLATRNQHRPFLPAAGTEDLFGVPLIFSTLQRRLQDLGKSKAGAEQWLKTIENFQKKGLRAEELDCSSLRPELMSLDEFGEQASACALAKLCCFKDIRLSVMPVVTDAQWQLRFGAVPGRTLRQTRRLRKPQAGQTRAVVGFDSVLGYRIEQVEHQALWGTDVHWQAVTHDGLVIGDDMKQTLFPIKESAVALAIAHAKLRFPKRLALGQWGRYAWTGGKEYREWLITLPYYPASYFSGHFAVRNVLAHVRCDIREGADGERVLLLQEVQSDWAQTARRAIALGFMKIHDEACPPFLKEWPALAIKLVLLHAVHQELDAVAWTRGQHQVLRYKGLGATGLIELYDRTLPREVNRMVKHLGCVCENLGVFVPTNFSIKQSESGYDVYTPENELLGTAQTLEKARQFAPDGGHELLYEVHGVRLSDAVRKAIRGSGFPAWG